jgi:hypothetical protein
MPVKSFEGISSTRSEDNGELDVYSRANLFMEEQRAYPCTSFLIMREEGRFIRIMVPYVFKQSYSGPSIIQRMEGGRLKRFEGIMRDETHPKFIDTQINEFLEKQKAYISAPLVLEGQDGTFCRVVITYASR